MAVPPATSPTNTSPPTTSPPLLPAFLRQTRPHLHAKFIDLEWQQRNRLLHGTQPPADPSAPSSPWSRLTGDAIVARNRYLNVEPYAANRVKLKSKTKPKTTTAAGGGGVAKEQEEDDELAVGSDYINASPIALGTRRYIATQGPKETGVAHFYRMLAQECAAEGPAVVVMLTQTHEQGREKCFPYFPMSAEDSPLALYEEGLQVGEVDLLGEVEVDEGSRCEVRRMRMRLRGGTRAEDGGLEEAMEEEKQIHHLLFSAWPDFLIPEGEDRAALIRLVHLSHTLNQPPTNTATNGHPSTSPDSATTNPRIIHCSAGVGRSGTFIALDHLLSLLSDGGLDHLPEGQATADVDAAPDPIAETVDRLRQQRMMMVQGEAQWNFLYDVLREAWEARAAGMRAAAGKGL